jgi:hypothetical protein
MKSAARLMTVKALISKGGNVDTTKTVAEGPSTAHQLSSAPTIYKASVRPEATM